MPVIEGEYVDAIDLRGEMSWELGKAILDCPICSDPDRPLSLTLVKGGQYELFLLCRCEPHSVVAALEQIAFPPALSNGKHEPPQEGAREPDLATQSTKKVARSEHLTERLAAAVLQEEYFSRDGGGKLYAFRHGVYAANGEARIESRVKGLLADWGKEWTQHRGHEVVEYIRIDTPELWERPPLSMLNLKNGLLQIKDMQLKAHHQRFLSPVQLPIEYVPTADCPRMRAFVEQTFPDDARAVAWQLFAWLMLPDTSIQKAVLLTGEGANGKSTFLAALAAFLGKRNLVSLSLQKLEAERFASARLVGRLANICPDLPSVHLSDTSMFKAITGGDSIAAEYKHRDGFDFTPFCRLVFSANHPPHSSDSSPAFFRRWLVLPFMHIFEGEAAIPRAELDKALADPAEQSGILNEALRVLPELRQNGFIESETMRQAWLDLRQATDPLAVWLDRETVEDPLGVWVRRDMWRAYQRDATACGRPPIHENVFGKALRKYRPGLVEAQRTIDGKDHWVWLGISPRPDPLQAQNETQATQTTQAPANCKRFDGNWHN